MGIYGRGGSAGTFGGDSTPLANTGSASGENVAAADGFVRITWFE